MMRLLLPSAIPALVCSSCALSADEKPAPPTEDSQVVEALKQVDSDKMAEIQKTSQSDKETINAFKRLHGCEVAWKHFKIPPHSKLESEKNGERNSDNSLEDMDELTVVVISGKGMGYLPLGADEGMGMQVLIMMKGERGFSLKPIASYSRNRAATYSVSYHQPEDCHEPWGFEMGGADGLLLRRVDRDANKVQKGNLILRIVPDEKAPLKKTGVQDGKKAETQPAAGQSIPARPR